LKIPRKSQRLCIAISATAAITAFVPVPYLASPKLDVVVVDSAGEPIEGITVRSVYQNYSAESAGHEEDQRTDKSGYAAFPAHWSSASTARRLVFTLRSAAMAGVHGGFGRHAYVFAFGKGLQGSAVSGQFVMDWTGTPEEIKTQMTVTPLPDPRYQ
jgi:hypothetical protein